MRNGRLSLTKQYVHSYARKDYTREELEYDRSLRKKAGQLNHQEGMLKYVKPILFRSRILRAHKHFIGNLLGVEWKYNNYG
ncbi:hypothetical protein ANCDUO_01801 [Ancylostoma duodenale]|uniref:Uncharacterized protein n=1 Tax=Ancylostoma duodenale TaxID=51022 RepID=A0A0C2H297_9BILA|nr:hypothetical protein ANCDUO_01801 [Ancylostoma duodenale]